MRNNQIVSQLFCALLQLCWYTTKARPVLTEIQLERERSANPRIVTYLVQYGYLGQQAMKNSSDETAILPNMNTTGIQGFSQEQITQALVALQQQFELQPTGELDPDTLEIMDSPRCGVKDKGIPFHNHTHHKVNNTWQRRRKRFVMEGSKWNKQILRFHVKKWSSKMANNKVNQTFIKAFRIWAEVCPLIFRWVDEPSEADILIKFLKDDHGDSQAFDGPGKILAHAFYPSYGGDIHLDDSETWAAEYQAGAKNLLRIATHEIGHSLGLEHTTYKSAVMNPVYKKHRRNRWTFRLHHDDINGIQDIYGKCETSITAIFSWMKNARTYIFKDNYYWRIYDWQNRSDFGYPRIIDEEWKNIPANIDEAFLWSYNWRTYFFKGDSYYRYSDTKDRVDHGYPRKIKEGWPGLPDDIDAAFSAADQVSYFFKDHLVYAFDNAKDRVADGFPQNISVIWPGIPDKVDTVFRYYFDAVTYFFKGINYWTWDEKKSIAVGPGKIRDRWKNLCFV